MDKKTTSIHRACVSLCKNIKSEWLYQQIWYNTQEVIFASSLNTNSIYENKHFYIVTENPKIKYLRYKHSKILCTKPLFLKSTKKSNDRNQRQVIVYTYTILVDCKTQIFLKKCQAI